MERRTRNVRWLFASDVDDTLLGDDAALRELNAVLARERSRIWIALNSSRPCRSLRLSLERNRGLPAPDFLIGALGTEIEDADGNPVEEYSHRFGSDWNREVVQALVPTSGTIAHPPEYQTPFKVSYDIDDASLADTVRSRLKDAHVAAGVIVTHGSKMDIIPDKAGKGAAISFLRERVAVSPDRVIVAGDSANDIDMFVGDSLGIVVANADPELAALDGPRIFKARHAYASGVLEGLRHWGVL